MHRLRTAPDAGVSPRPAMARLAQSFPGALREIDELPLDEIERRIAHLVAVDEGRPAERWVAISHRYHELLRVALDVKARRVPGSAWGDGANDLLEPPTGRITDVVLARLARELDLPLVELRAVLFPFARVRTR